jgi:hypothetical protein
MAFQLAQAREHEAMDIKTLMKLKFIVFQPIETRISCKNPQWLGFAQSLGLFD